MKITINIPNEVIKHCKKLGIPEDNIPSVMEAFFDDITGFNSPWGIDSFTEWCAESDNLVDFQE